MEIVVRATIIYFFVYVLLRVMGKRELGELSAFELVLLVMVGDLVQQAVTEEDYSLTGAVLAVSTIAFWVVLSSYLTFRFSRARSLLEGQAVIVIRDGQVQREVLSAERVSMEELGSAARKQGIEDLRTVKLGVLEADGKFSFLGQGSGGGSRDQERQAH
jgi:uncharacterized membrane protein YcaP (DUF421 family)